MLDIHQINTGKGDAALFVFPDGTTLLLDAGALAWVRPPHYEAPAVPNDSRRAGEWIARYVRAMHPRRNAPVLDYGMITHYHGDHMGNLTADAPRAAAGSYRLTGITDVAEHVPIRVMLDRSWPDYDVSEAMMENYQAFLQWQVRNRGLRVERFEPGRRDQVVLSHAPERFPEFEFYNVAAGGRVATGVEGRTRDRFPAEETPGENAASIAFRLRYGRFTYFNGGDMPGMLPPTAPGWQDMESAVAWEVGPVDVHALNHHGFKDSANPFFLSVLRPRIHILAVYASSHPAPDVMRRMLSENIYPGPRDVFLTNGMWEGRRPNMVNLFGEEETAWLEERLAAAPAAGGHIVVRVDPGGGRYRVVVLDDRSEDRTVLSVHGPYDAATAPPGAAAGR